MRRRTLSLRSQEFPASSDRWNFCRSTRFIPDSPRPLFSRRADSRAEATAKVIRRHAGDRLDRKTEELLRRVKGATALEEAGVPPGVVNVVPSRRSGAVVSAMLHDPRVRVVSFTGSTEVGRKLLHEAADNILKPSMELGGNAPFIVFEDADVDAAIDGAMIAKMRNMGEACTAANRFYVHERVHDAFAKKLTDKMASLKMGNGLDDGVALGPLVNAEGRAKCKELVEDAVKKGAKVLTGGKLPDGCAMFGGTFAAKGGIRPADRFEYELEDPVLKRVIGHAYDVITLPVRG